MGDALEYFFFSVVLRIARRISFHSAGVMGSFLGNAVFTVTGYRRKVTLENLRNAFRDKSPEEVHALARAAFRNYGIALVESLWAAQQSPETLMEILRIENPEIMSRARAVGKGVLLLSAHFGSWELLPSSVRLQLQTPLTMVVQRQRNKKIDAVFDSSRSRFGNMTIRMGPSSRKVLTALRENRVVLMLGDQSGPKEAVFVEFFGRPAATHRGVAAFSLKTGAPIVLGLVIRQADGTYALTMEEIDRSGLNSPNDEDNIVELTRRHTAALERWIRIHPDHWLWMHKRWKHTEYYREREGSEVTA